MRIYYNNQCIFFGQSASEIIEQESLRNAWIVRNAVNPMNIFQSFISSNVDHLIMEGDEATLFNSFQDQFSLIQAGGGIVWNEQRELLMIHRLGKWDLPKGKLDPDEDLASCSLREVEEETGLQNVEIIKGALPTYHLYHHNGDWILKHTAWYEMRATKQELIPQAEEDISQAIWVPKARIGERLENSYPNIIYLLKGLY